MNDKVIKFAKAKPDAIIPTKRDEDAGYDIYPCFEESFIRIPAHETKMIPTGIASVIPTGYYFQIEERGSTGTKGIKTSSGVIDAGYRGEWNLVIYNSNDKDLFIVKEDYLAEISLAASIIKGSSSEIIIYPYEKALAQAVLHQIPVVSQEEISYEELLKIPSERGTGKLGSSNK